VVCEMRQDANCGGTIGRSRLIVILERLRTHMANSEREGVVTSGDVLRRYFEVEMTRNVDAILDMFIPTAVFQTPDQVRSGRAAIKPFYEDSVSRFSILEVVVKRALTDGPWGAAEWSATLRPLSGDVLLLEGINIAEIADGRIVQMRSYYDVSAYQAPPAAQQP
jgi:ketosteroid isomerase-like protein